MFKNLYLFQEYFLTFIHLQVKSMFSQLAKKQKQTEVKGQKPPKKPKLDEDAVPKPKPRSRVTKPKTMPDWDEISDEELIQMDIDKEDFERKEDAFDLKAWLEAIDKDTPNPFDKDEHPIMVCSETQILQ